MSRYGFDFPNTCPTIDRKIKTAQVEMKSFINNLIEDICPYIPAKERENMADSYARELYASIEDCFEVVRNTNEEMRDEADRQITALQDQISDLEAVLKEAQQNA